MSTLTISFPAIPNFQLSGTITLRVYYDRSFIASDSTPVQGGAVGSSEWFVEVECTVDEDAHTLTIPSFNLITTDNALPAGSINATATAVFYRNGAQLDFLFSQFTIPASLAPTTSYSVLAIFNAAVTLVYPSNTFFTREQVVALIATSVPGLHHATHENAGDDEINVAGLSGVLADQQVPSTHHTRHENSGNDEIAVTGLSGLLADPQTPLGHHTSHEAGGSDVVKLDDLGTPDDNTDLNATAGHHGLLPKLSGSGTQFLNGTGAFSTPADTGITQLTSDVIAGPGNGSQTATIPNDTVTYGKMQNASANVVLTRAAGSSGDIGETALAASQLLGRGASGDVAAIVLGTNLSMSGTTLNATGGSGSSSFASIDKFGNM